MFSTATERGALCGFLDQARDALIRKAEGLSDVDARAAPTASSLSMLSLLKHAAAWEARWFQVVFAGRSSPTGWPAVDEGNTATFTLDPEDTVDSVVTCYRRNIALSRDIVADADLDTRCARPDLADGNLRWLLLHLLQETARHVGHADIVRESLDGTRGL